MKQEKRVFLLIVIVSYLFGILKSLEFIESGKSRFVLLGIFIIVSSTFILLYITRILSGIGLEELGDYK
jgi:hypothetical protein